MRDALHIRPATKRDLEAVLGLYRHLSPDDVLPDGDAAAAIWTEVLDAPGVTPLVGEVAGEIVATCTLVVVPNLTRGGRPFAFVENVVTHRAHRRRGHGLTLLQAAAQLAWSSNCYKIVLSTARTDEATLSFYEKAGFQRGTRTVFELRR
jgi:GNAT superfamily N-acetyltransferase